MRVQLKWDGQLMNDSSIWTYTHNSKLHQVDFWCFQVKFDHQPGFILMLGHADDFKAAELINLDLLCYFHWWSQILFQLTTFWWLNFFGCDSSNCLFAGEYGWIDVFRWMEEWVFMDRWFILLIKLASYPMKKSCMMISILTFSTS